MSWPLLATSGWSSARTVSCRLTLYGCERNSTVGA